MKYKQFSVLFWFTSFFLFSPDIGAQDAWKKIRVKGKVTISSVTKAKYFNSDGETIREEESELGGETEELLTFFIDRYGVLATNDKKLTEFNRANAHHIMMGEPFDDKTSKPNIFPVTFYTKSKTWEQCGGNGPLILVQTSESSGTSQVVNTQTHLSMIQIRSREKVAEDKMMAKAMDEFARRVMEAKKESDLKAGKTGGDYFVPANLYNPDMFGLYLFTNWWTTDFRDQPVQSKHRKYDCDFKKWRDLDGDKTALTISNNNLVLAKDFNEEGTQARFRYIPVDNRQLEEFIKDPSKPVTLTTASLSFTKEEGVSEIETRDIITLTVQKVQ